MLTFIYQSRLVLNLRRLTASSACLLPCSRMIFFVTSVALLITQSYGVRGFVGCCFYVLTEVFLYAFVLHVSKFSSFVSSVEYSRIK